MRRKPSPITIIILTGIGTLVGSFLVNLATNTLPTEVTQQPFYPWVVWSLVILITALGIYLAIVQYRLQKSEEALPATLERQNRRLMLDKVQSTRIDSVLGKPLPGVVPLVLSLQERSDLVSNPSKPRFQQPDVTTPIPSTDIRQIYESAGHALLILGKSGSGKTTLLLQLARELIAQARQDDSLPIPVVFHLSSWAVKRQPLADWLVDELRFSYHIEPPLAQQWVERNQLLLLLDGLDRIPAQHLEACVKEINAYHDSHGLVSIVVCSRDDEYLKLKRRLLLQKAIVVNLLSPSEVDDYLSRQGEHLSPLRTAIRNDPDLQHLAATPLILTLLPFVYQGQLGKNSLITGAPGTWQEQIIGHFIQRMLQDPGTRARYTVQKATQWLAWLAWQMKGHHQTEVYLERMQPDWLPATLREAFYGAVYIIVGSLCGGLIFGMLSSYRFGPLVAVKTGLEWIVLSPFCLYFFNKKAAEGQPLPATFSLLWRRLYFKFAQRSVLILAVIVFSFIQLAAIIEQWLGLGLTVGLVETPLQLALAGVVSNLLLVGVLSTLLDAIIPDISPVEYVSWSWKAITHNLRKSVLVGSTFGLLVMLDIAGILLPVQGLGEALSRATGGGLILAFIGGLTVTIINGLASGLPGVKLDERTFTVPNQGIHRSAQNSVVLGMLSGAFIGMMSELIITLIFWPSVGWLQGFRSAAIYAVLLGILSGVAVGLVKGGVACIQHFTLRLFLRTKHYAPFNYPSFLHYVAGCNLLYRVGAGYIFFHPLVQDYLATQVTDYFPELDTTPPPDTPREPDRQTESNQITKKSGKPGQRKLTHQRARHRRNS